MRLNVLERIIGINVLDTYKEGNFITFKTIENLRLKLLVSEEEVGEFGLKIDGDQYTWNAKGNDPKEVDITDGEKKILRDQLTKLDTENKLTPQHVSLYEKIVAE
jgi:hypothetical protein